MYNLKRSFNFVISMFVIIGMIFSSFALNATNAEENKYTLTLEGLKGHELEIYQIFTGDIAEKDGNKVLSNIKYGSSWKNKNGIVEDSFLGKFNNEKTALAIAKGLLKNNNNISPMNINPTDDGNNVVFKNLDPGYYLVRDKDGSQNKGNKENGAYTLYILKMVGDATAKAKIGVPTVEKFVKEVNDTTGENSWKKTADHDIDDEVEFKLEATLPENYDKYKKYKLIFHDELSNGFDYVDFSAKGSCTINGSEKKINISYLPVKPNNKNNFTITIDDLKSQENLNGLKAGDKIVVTYKAKLNENAVIGGEGNPNTVYLEYSNNPNKDDDGDTGKTPKDEVRVYTYKLIINKTDGKNALEGAEFKLQKKINGEYKDYSNNFVMQENKTQFIATGLDAGDYKIIETKTPNGYNTIKDIEFKIDAAHTKENNGEFKLSRLLAKSPTGNSDSEGSSVINGVELNNDTNAGSLTGNIVNKKGSTLPETGGMGTKMIYVGGSLFVLLALGYLAFDKKYAKNK